MQSRLDQLRVSIGELIARGRTLLALSRLSILPTVWSNCLAGWLLSGGGSAVRFMALCWGATCVYLGGVYLSDACDAQFDAANHRERPIPAGAISLQTVFLLSLGWFAAGALILVSLGKPAAILTILLLGGIVLYDVVHKMVAFSPIIMAVCRFFLYLVAGSAAANGPSGMTVWSGLALSAYVAGLNYLVRKESIRTPMRAWPNALFGVPILLAWIANGPEYRLASLFFCLILIGWTVWCLHYTFWTAHQNISLTVAGLTAGIILVDLLAVLGGSVGACALFLLWFLAALLLEKVAP